MRAAGIDFVAQPLCVQVTAAVLSQNMPTCLRARLEWVISRMRYPRSMAASSRSMMVMSPLVKRALIWGGHSYCHTT